MHHRKSTPRPARRRATWSRRTQRRPAPRAARRLSHTNPYPIAYPVVYPRSCTVSVPIVAPASPPESYPGTYRGAYLRSHRDAEPDGTLISVLAILLAAALGLFAALVPEQADAGLIDSDLAISGSWSFSNSSFLDGNATSRGIYGVRSGGTLATAETADNGVTSGTLPLAGALVEEGDGLTIDLTGSGSQISGAVAELEFFHDLAIDIVNGGGDRFEVVFEVDFRNLTEAAGPALANDSFVQSVLQIDQQAPTALANLFFTDIDADTRDANPDSDADLGTRGFSLTVGAGQTFALRGRADLAAGSFADGSSFSGRLQADIRVARVRNLDAPPAATLAVNGPLDFGAVRTGTVSAPLPVVATNAGEPGSRLAGTFGEPSGDFAAAGPAGFGPLEQGESASRAYRYAPSANGADSIPVPVDSDAGPAAVVLTGLGVGPVFDSNAPGGIVDFGPVALGSLASFDLEIANRFGDPALGDALTGLTILGFSFSGADAGLLALAVDPTGILISALESRTLRLLLAPDRVLAGLDATLTLLTDLGAPLGQAGQGVSFRIAGSVFERGPELPVPGAAALMGLGLLGLGIARGMGRRVG